VNITLLFLTAWSLPHNTDMSQFVLNEDSARAIAVSKQHISVII